jgi:hypothetical protein
MDKKNLTDRFKKSRVGVQCCYILDAIKNSSCVNDENIVIRNDKEAVELFAKYFNEEFNYSYNKKRYPILQNRIAQYLRGLPSVCSVAYSDYDIKQIGKSWGFCQSEKEADEFVENWWSILAFRILQLVYKLDI